MAIKQSVTADAARPRTGSNRTYHAKNRALHGDMVEARSRLAMRIAELEDNPELVESDRAVRRLRTRTDRLCGELVQANMGLISSLVGRFCANGLHQDDYLQAAIEGFLQAVGTWDPEVAELATYVTPYVYGKLRREVHHNEAPGISYSDWTARTGVRTAEEALRNALGRAPSDSEIASHLGTSSGVVERARAKRPLSLSAGSGDSDTPLSDLIVDFDAGAAEPRGSHSTGDGPAYQASLLVAIDDAGLSPKELWVLVRREGLDDAPPQSYNDIGDETGLGRELCRRHHRRASAKLDDLAAKKAQPGFSGNEPADCRAPLAIS